MKRIIRAIRSPIAELLLPRAARGERLRDHRLGVGNLDPGIEAVLHAAIDWLEVAQDRSATADGGVARHYSLIDGWGESYPETTGYIVPTFLDYARRTEDGPLRDRARRMLEWLVSMQFPDGGFPGGTATQQPCVPVTFNTGQILLGLAAGAREFGEPYHAAMQRAADWLVVTQDPDGCWRRFPTPFAAPGEKAYETHVAWGLLEAGRVVPEAGYDRAALANVKWALGHQRQNGWIAKCCLIDERAPLTHTIGYALRGVIEAYLYTRDVSLLAAACRTADGLLQSQRVDGGLPGRLDDAWQGTVPWSCLTGNVQIAHCWLLLYQETGDERYRRAGFAANAFVRRTVKIEGATEVRGAVKGSLPVDGGYGAYQYLNWACKFLIDSHLLEQALRRVHRGDA